MRTTKIEVGSLWWHKGEEPVCEVLYADERSVAYRDAAGIGPVSELWVGWILYPEDFVRLYEPVTSEILSKETK